MNNLIEKIVDKKGIELNEMQIASIDAILNTDDDIIILSPTGSGKTFAYLLPLIASLDPLSNQVQAVVIVPSRELAIQSHSVFNSLGSGLRSFASYGGHATMDEHRSLRKVLPHIIFATPGRLNDHLNKGNIDVDTIRWVVLDEFDKSLEMGFLDEMTAVFEKLPTLVRHLFLSATDLKQVPNFVKTNEIKKLNFLVDEEQIPARIQIYKVESKEKDKLNTLLQILKRIGNQSSIVFLNYRESVERTATNLQEQGFVVSSYHGGLDQAEREAALYKFVNGSVTVLVSTDLSSRGLDIPLVSNIIHYHMPENEESYIHRVGRTARWDKSGRSFFIIGPGEHIPDYINAEVLDFEITTTDASKQVPLPNMVTIYIGKGHKDKISKGDIVGFLCKKGKLKKDEIGRIDVKDYYCYAAISRIKLNQVLQLTKGEKIKGLKTVIETVS